MQSKYDISLNERENFILETWDGAESNMNYASAIIFMLVGLIRSLVYIGQCIRSLKNN